MNVLAPDCKLETLESRCVLLAISATPPNATAHEPEPIAGAVAPKTAVVPQTS